MNVADWLQSADERLRDAEVPTARLDALVLLEDAMSIERAQLLAYPGREIPTDTQNVLNSQLERRAQHEPLAFVRGKTEFYGREFVVSAAVLEPRPESETMIELLLKRTDLPAHVRIADVGAGSGALGITAQLELPAATVELLEIDSAAIEVAKTNVIKLTTGIGVIKSDLLAESSHDYDVLLCNLPYVPDAHTVNAAALHEPKIAIFGGADGLDLYRKLFQQIDNLPNQPLLILSESLPPQHDALQAIAEKSGYVQDKEDDFIQVFKLPT